MSWLEFLKDPSGCWIDEKQEGKGWRLGNWLGDDYSNPGEMMRRGAG